MRCQPFGGCGIQTGQRDDELAAVAGDAATGWALSQLPGALTVHLGFRRITQPQFDAGADLILQRRPYLGPPRRRDDDMYAVRKALGGKRGDGCLKRVELLTNSSPAVDDEEHVAIRVTCGGRIGRT